MGVRGAPADSVTVVVDEVVVEGLPFGWASRLGDELERELRHVISARGIPPSLRAGEDAAELHMEAIQLPPGADARAMSRSLATALVVSLDGIWRAHPAAASDEQVVEARRNG
jgi:hypothetical protein